MICTSFVAQSSSGIKGLGSGEAPSIGMDGWRPSDVVGDGRGRRIKPALIP